MSERAYASMAYQGSELVRYMHIAGIMLPHTLGEKPHVSDNAVDFSRSVPSLITASPFFIKIHGKFPLGLHTRFLHQNIRLVSGKINCFALNFLHPNTRYVFSIAHSFAFHVLRA